MRTWTLAIAALAACEPTDGSEPVVPVDLEITRAEVVEAMPTTVRVTVTASEEVDWIGVEFGEGEALDRLVQVEDGEATLFGLPPGTEITLRAVTDGGASEPVRVTTGALDGAPTPQLDGGDLGLWAAIPVMSDQETWALLVAPKGRVVWAWRDRSGLATFRVRVAKDRGGIVYNRAEAGPSEGAALVRVSWDGVETVTPLPELAHDFVERPDGTVVALGYEERAGVLANTLVEVAPDGATRTLWAAWDCLDPALNPGDDPTHGWTHANALDQDADGWLVGLRNLSTIVKVDPDGSCPWAIGGTGGTLAVTGQAFQHQHQFERAGDRLLVFDNDGAPGNPSRVLEYTLDLQGGTAQQVATLLADPPEVTFILGDVHRGGSDETWVAWATSGAIDRFGADGTRVTRLSLSGFGRVGFFDLHDEL